MQNAKLGILATIGLVGLSILAGCTAKASSATRLRAPSAAAEAPSPPPPAPVGKRLGVVLNAPKGKQPTSFPPSVTLHALHHDQIVWVNAAANDMVVTFNDPSMGSPFQEGSPGAASNVYEAQPGEAVLSGPLKTDVKYGTYRYVLTVKTETGATTEHKDGDVIIKR